MHRCLKWLEQALIGNKILQAEETSISQLYMQALCAKDSMILFGERFYAEFWRRGELEENVT